MKTNQPITAFESLESRQLFSAGVLDTSFSGDGKATVPITFSTGADKSFLFAKDVAVQGDGTTVIAGELARQSQEGQKDFAVARLNFDGTLDKTFGDRDTPGLFTHHFGTRKSQDEVNAVVVQSDGKIVVAGSAIRFRRFLPDHRDMAVMRLLPDGTFDKSFDGDGRRFVEFDDGSSASDIALEHDGKIVLAGTGGKLGDFNFAVARLNLNGSLDNSFDGNGRATIDLEDEDKATAVAIDYSGSKRTNPNYGKIVIAGITHAFDDPTYAIARLNTNGSADKTFNRNGTRVTTFVTHDFALAEDVLVQSDGKYVVAGFADVDRSNKANRQVTLLRYLPSGTLDGSFGTVGTGLVETDLGGQDVALDVLQSSDGGLIAGGIVDGKFALAGYTADGVLKPSFGTNGSVITDFGADGTANSVGMAKGPGKRIVLAGGDLFKTARYLDDGSNVVSAGSFDPHASEGGSNNATIIVGRSERLPVPTRVFFSIGGSARGGEDYTLSGMNGIGASGFVDIPAGQTFTTVTLAPRDDSAAEGTETATFSIVPNPSYQLGNTAAATLDIADNDAAPARFPAVARSIAPSFFAIESKQLFSDELITDLTSH
jgi:uncharacterized delta-60 repeat protein